MGSPILPTVAVTGGTGFVATELIKQLLERGFNVHATVRSVSASEKNEPLLKLAAALPGELGWSLEWRGPHQSYRHRRRSLITHPSPLSPPPA